MTRGEVIKFRKILETDAVELNRSARGRDSIAIERTADALDQTLLASQRELAVRSLETQSRNLRRTREALRRIQHGTYGICQECDQPINPKRLAAMPNAELCIRCQEAADGHTHPPVFAMAA